MKYFILALLVALLPSFLYSQEEEKITGKVLDAKTRQPLQAVVARIIGTHQFTLTDKEGAFTLHPSAPGKWEIGFSSPAHTTKRYAVEISALESLDLGHLLLEEDWISAEQLGLITLTEEDLEEDESPAIGSARFLQATKDPFQQAAAYAWGQSQFRIRGLDNAYGKLLLNGVVMNKIQNHRPQWSNWGGLNEVTRNQLFYQGSSAAAESFGGIWGTQTIQTQASSLRKGTRVGFAGSTTSYLWKPFFSYASGLTPRNWAYSFSGSYRGAKAGYWQGTNYDALSFFIGIEKKISDKHSLNFSGIYAKNKRAKNSANTQEQTKLKGVTYNSYWGWQNGEKRNARYQNIEEPLVTLTHSWAIKEQTKLTTTLGYQWGYQGQSRLDYQDNLNPDPAYYKNLPSYYLTQIDKAYWSMTREEFEMLPNEDAFKQATLANLQQAEQVGTAFQQQGQLHWQEIYNSNSLFNGQSKIVLYEDRQQDQTRTFTTNFQTTFSTNITFYAGVNYRHLQSSNFKKLIDLLGGTHYMDIDSFQAKELQDSNVLHPNRSIVVGDHYGHNYKLFATTVDAFSQFVFRYNRLEFYFAENISFSQYQREGLYKNPHYPTQSYGPSERVDFNTLGIKGGFTYYVSGKHLFQAQAMYYNQAPSIQNSFANIRISNAVIPQLKAANIFSLEGSYRFRSPTFQGRVTGYLAEIQNDTQLNFFYTEGIAISEAKGNLVSERITNSNRRHRGVELGAAYALTSTVNLSAAAALGQSSYTNNPNVHYDAIDTAQPVDLGQALLANYKVSNGPQTALSLGITYRAPTFWFIGATINYLADAFVRIAPIKRTQHFIRDPEQRGRPFEGLTTAHLRQLLQQERLPAYSLVSLSAGKSWRLFNRSTFGFFASIQNVFNTTYRTGGFEQARNATYAQEQKHTSGAHTVFGTKYWYGYGRNFFIQIYYTI
ncbi:MULTISPECIES: carboxypeptidase-like regulatory domain-containing protein [unclassified Myroides]|uniref:carboxypeptidase-like regulatory domain-containing protein n=1 Tax=unclassified Myroides TaxID=2642485 RepID=UPI003D2F6A2A